MDYSRQTDPSIKLEELPKDFLIELLKLYSRFYLAVDGFWYLSVKERISNEEALACDIKVWEIMAGYEIKRLTNLLGASQDDVANFMKVLQLSPWFWNLKYEMEVKDRSQAILTIGHCPTLETLEKEGEGREKTICKEVDTVVFQKYAQSFNPDMEAAWLKLPPRKSKDEICCQWQFKIK